MPLQDRMRGWSAGTRLAACACVGWFVISACSSSGSGNDIECACPSGEFLVTVPADRASDIQSLRASGACSNASRFGCERYSVEEDSVGTCHIAVTFRSGAPEFDTDVALARGTFECEAVCAPTPVSPVVIPDVDGGSGVGEQDGGCELGAGGGQD
jgi:hypothetical protein